MKRRVRGQSMVELALILPFLLLITVGTMELGYYIYTYSELENATRRASEWASTTPPWTTDPCDDFERASDRTCTGNKPADECATLIKQNALDGVVLSRIVPSNITISYPGTSRRQPGDEVQVRMTYRGQWLSPIGRRFFGNALNFSFTSRRTIQSVEPPAGRNVDCTSSSSPN